MASSRPLPFLLTLTIGFFVGMTAMAKPVILPSKAPIPQPSKRSAKKPLAQSNPAEIPIPPQKPTDLAPQKPAEAIKKLEKKPDPIDPRSADVPLEEMPTEEIACRTRLKALGVKFEERKAESDPESGCSIPYPLMVKTLATATGIAPQAEMNCKMAEAVARFVADMVSPAAKATFGAELKAVSHASAYVCRPRRNGQKMSEHAFGNALDIASFTLTDGMRIEVEPMPKQESVKKFLGDVRKAACGPFKTVLGPGSDADHALHFHLDLQPRRNGGTFCQ